MNDIDRTIVVVVVSLIAVGAVVLFWLVVLTYLWWALPWVCALIIGPLLGAELNRNTGSLVLAVVPTIVLLGAASILSKRWFPWAIDHGPDELWNWVARSLGIPGSARSKRFCPKCRGSSLSEESDYTHYDTTMTETRRTTHYDADGTPSGYSEEEHEVPAVSSHVSYRLQCKECNHTWTI